MVAKGICLMNLKYDNGQTLSFYHVMYVENMERCHYKRECYNMTDIRMNGNYITAGFNAKYKPVCDDCLQSFLNDPNVTIENENQV